MISFRVIKFLEYLLFSGHRKGHGIHSPFVFDLVSRIFRNKIDPDIVLTIENIRKKNISDKRIISVLDLGAGSSKMKTSLRKVSEIAEYSSVPQKYGVLLANLAAEFGKPAIIEFGTSLGISAMYMAKACPDALVYTLEGCSSISEIAEENFSIAGIENIRLLNGSFDDLIPELKRLALKPGLVFIDGNHKKEPVTRYFKEMAEISDTGTVIVLDDIHHSSEMEEAWDEIKMHEKTTFTIDICRLGFVFFREGMNHFNYVIRY
jgi:predicted O-methyltransferase YrrM